MPDIPAAADILKQRTRRVILNAEEVLNPLQGFLQQQSRRQSNFRFAPLPQAVADQQGNGIQRGGSGPFAEIAGIMPAHRLPPTRLHLKIPEALRQDSEPDIVADHKSWTGRIAAECLIDARSCDVREIAFQPFPKIAGLPFHGGAVVERELPRIIQSILGKIVQLQHGNDRISHDTAGCRNIRHQHPLPPMASPIAQLIDNDFQIIIHEMFLPEG